MDIKRNTTTGEGGLDSRADVGSFPADAIHSYADGVDKQEQEIRRGKDSRTRVLRDLSRIVSLDDFEDHFDHRKVRWSWTRQQFVTRKCMITPLEGVVLLAFVGYIVLSVWMMNINRGYSILDTLYFMSSTATTVGYGDLNFKNRPIFGAFWCLGTLVIMTMSLTIMVDRCSETITSLFVVNVPEEGRAVTEREAMSQEFKLIAKNVFIALFTLGLFLGIGTLAFAHAEDTSYADACYWSMISMLTIGYGDIVTKTTAGKIFCCFYIWGATFTTTGTIIYICHIPMLWKRSRSLQQSIFQFGPHLRYRSLAALLHDPVMNNIAATESIGKHRISKSEFVLWLVIRGELVERDWVEKALAVFETLDCNNDGFLDSDDVVRDNVAGDHSDEFDYDTEPFEELQISRNTTYGAVA